jgi:hypothetical protein
MHQRLVREYVPFASACLNSHNADKPDCDRFLRDGCFQS